MTCAPNEDHNQTALSRSLISVFVVRMKKLCFRGYPKCDQWRFWSDCKNMQADLNLLWAHVRRHILWRFGSNLFVFIFNFSVFRGYTMDVICSTGFGIEVDSQRNPDNPFIKYAKELLEVEVAANPLNVFSCKCSVFIYLFLSLFCDIKLVFFIHAFYSIL